MLGQTTACAQLNFTRNEGKSQIIEIYRYGETTMRVTGSVCIYKEQCKTALCWNYKSNTNTV
jgi:hypothetical protein